MDATHAFSDQLSLINLDDQLKSSYQGSNYWHKRPTKIPSFIKAMRWRLGLARAPFYLVKFCEKLQQIPPNLH